MGTERIILFGGPPGSGKSSVAEIVSKGREGEIDHLSVGNHLRHIGQRAVSSCYYDQLAHHRKTLSGSGRLPVELVLGITKEYLVEATRCRTVLIDGYPRSKEQVDPFFELIENLKIVPSALIHMDVSPEVAVQRMVNRGLRKGEKTTDIDFAVERIRKHNEVYPEAITEISKYIPIFKINAEAELDRSVESATSYIEECT